MFTRHFSEVFFAHSVYRKQSAALSILHSIVAYTVCSQKDPTTFWYSVMKSQLNALINWHNDLRDNCESVCLWLCLPSHLRNAHLVKRLRQVTFWR